MKPTRSRILGFAAAFLLSACLLWLYITFIASDSVYNGLRVARKTQWYGYSQVLPIPTGRFSVYYAYQDPTGAWIREGPYVEYYSNGHVRFERYYVHGQPDGKESVFNEAGIEMFRTNWDQGKEVRRIHCPCVDP
jgi:hypothetical protein